MREGWELLLDVLGLSAEDNENARLEVLLKTDGRLYKDKRNRVVEIIRDKLNTNDEFTIIKPPILGWSSESGSLNPFFEFLYKTISLSDISYFVERWEIDGGDWLVIVPGRFTPHIDDIYYYDEEFIGRYLTQNRSILLKSPDGYDFMHLYIEDKKNGEFDM
ncbi:MAG: hypothetical protein A2Y23_04885 [Clostridiales bacterium GWB2_37_7]|nr:MAG: hypothetical protein A2Y23_04885 [Clostridiales bacterium GWB2_37_7]